eukprot:TRINITY_DN14461_c0_g1_i1.p1 TRINITY_DN14461_c0_g1~~TRINITY_DN14461_c0_g1_i1.p1  ORF type:complete len:260 (+),score=66.54 TRINITY_DN14461_c0_g1_i1:138-917(+)
MCIRDSHTSLVKELTEAEIGAQAHYNTYTVTHQFKSWAASAPSSFVLGRAVRMWQLSARYRVLIRWRESTASGMKETELLRDAVVMIKLGKVGRVLMDWHAWMLLETQERAEMKTVLLKIQRSGLVRAFNSLRVRTNEHLQTAYAADKAHFFVQALHDSSRSRYVKMWRGDAAEELALSRRFHQAGLAWRNTQRAGGLRTWLDGCRQHNQERAGLELSLIHISEPTRLLSISYAVFCLKKKKKTRREALNSALQISLSK